VPPKKSEKAFFVKKPFFSLIKNILLKSLFFGQEIRKNLLKKLAFIAYLLQNAFIL